MRLNNFESHMTSLRACWEGVLVNYQCIRSGNTITWPNRERVDYGSATKTIATIIEKRQYSMQVLDDGSPIQLYYAYNSRGDLVEASLGFLHSGNIQEEPIESIEGGVLPIADANRPSGWIRIDYDPTAARDVLHFHSHMHVSICSEMRIPIANIPTPKQFIELIIAWFYPDQYRSVRMPNDEFQMCANTARDLFSEHCQVQTTLPTLNGIHIYVP